MMGYLKAKEQVTKVARSRKLSEEWTSLISSQGRVLARSIEATSDLPHFSNSAMDGYAVSSQDTKGASSVSPIRLKILKSIAAGESCDSLTTESFTALEIMTGAKIPNGRLDAVVRIEDVERTESEILISKEVLPGENYRRRGDDFSEGQRVLQAGSVLTPERIAVLAAFGVDPVPVIRKPRVAVISTGKELVPWSEKEVKGAEIRNSSAPYLLTELKSLGADVEYLGNIPDQAQEFYHLLQSLVRSSKYDVILTTGAVSVGRFDFIESTVKDTGAEIVFHKVAIRPGKPILFAQWENGPVLFGLPGNVISSMVGYRFFVYPYLKKILNESGDHISVALLDNDFRKPEGLTCFYRAHVFSIGAEKRIQVLSDQKSYKLSPMLAANAWAVLHEKSQEFSKGSLISYVKFQCWRTVGE